MKNYTSPDPKFSDKILIVETTDPAHADNINAAPEQLLQNTIVNKKNIDVVTKGKCLPNQVWKTDKDGNPGWRPESKGFYVTFADGTWSEIKMMLDLHYAGELNIADYWSVGDEKTITLSAVEGIQDVVDPVSERKITIVIIGINHDDLTTPINGVGKAAITIGLKYPLNYGRIHNIDNIERGWIDMSIRTWCNDMFMNALPYELKSILKAVDKTSFSWNDGVITITTSDMCWFVSSYEADLNPFYPFTLEGNPYDFYKTQSNRMKEHPWWTRSINYGSSNSFKIITNEGTNGQYTVKSYRATLPHFCI